MLGMKNHFDINGSIEIREVDIAKVACILSVGIDRSMQTQIYVLLGFITQTLIGECYQSIIIHSSLTMWPLGWHVGF